MHLDMCILGLEAEATSGGAKSYRLVGSRIRKPCPLGSMPPNMISRFLQLYESTILGPCARFL